MNIQQREIDNVRLKLVQAIDAMTHLLNMIHYHASMTNEPSTEVPGLPPYPEIITRYRLILSHLVGLGGSLTAKPAFRDKWQGALLAPGLPVEESKDWIVGYLTQSKPPPMSQEYLLKLVEDLPVQFKQPETFSEAFYQHANLMETAFQVTQKYKQGVNGTAWNWKERVVESDDEDNEEQSKQEKMQVEPIKTWSIEQFVQYQKTGVVPQALKRE